MDEIPPTLRQIAQKAGVDRSTVSLALRNDRRLRPATCRRIQKLAQKMGYRKNPTVAQLMTQLRVGQKAHFHSNLAVIDFGIPPWDASHPVMQGIRSKARLLGYEIEVFHAIDWMPVRLEQILVSRGIRGLVLCGLKRRNSIPEEYQALCSHFPNCVCGVHSDRPSLNFVVDDNYMTAMTAVRKLREMGFKKIGFALNSNINVETEYRFLGGYLTGHLESPALQHPPILIMEPDDRQKFLTWFQPGKFEVIVCIQKEILTWLLEANYRIPEDVNLVHLDLDPAGKGWAGMRQRKEFTGVTAVEMLVNQINNGQTGLPDVCQGSLIESVWELGDTLALPSREKKPDAPAYRPIQRGNK